MLAAAAPAPSPSTSARSTLKVLGRSIAQDQGAWVVAYDLRHEGATGLVVTPTEIFMKVEGWVSNSRVPAHAAPRWSSVVVSGATELAGVGDVLTTTDDSRRCRERVVLQAWTIDDPSGAATSCPPPPPPSVNGRITPPARQPILSLAPGARVRVRLRLEHLHAIYGDYDPLLGVRAVDVNLGAATFRDALPVDHEHYHAQPRAAWPDPPEDRRDTRYYTSAPDSLHLEAHIPGNQYYRFPERPVRYATTMRLRFRYLIAAGTEGECRATLAQYKDTPTSWKVLAEGGLEERLGQIGRWTTVERIFRTQPETTTVALDFRISGADVGEMWIDDVTLEPVAAHAQAGP